jgi:hypothetical protein
VPKPFQLRVSHVPPRRRPLFVLLRAAVTVLTARIVPPARTQHFRETSLNNKEEDYGLHAAHSIENR